MQIVTEVDLRRLMIAFFCIVFDKIMNFFDRFLKDYRNL